MKACFIGHRTVENKEQLAVLIRETVISLINKGVKTFLFGSKSEFDDLSWKIVSELKTKYSFIKRVYARSSHKDIDNSYKEYLLKLYEETYFLPKLENAGKYSYVERNYEMIDQSTYCVFYYNEDYRPLLKRQANNDKTLKRNSGTKTAYIYAMKKKKTIINLYK